MAGEARAGSSAAQVTETSTKSVRGRARASCARRSARAVRTRRRADPGRDAPAALARIRALSWASVPIVIDAPPGRPPSPDRECETLNTPGPLERPLGSRVSDFRLRHARARRRRARSASRGRARGHGPRRRRCRPRAGRAAGRRGRRGRPAAAADRAHRRRGARRRAAAPGDRQLRGRLRQHRPRRGRRARHPGRRHAGRADRRDSRPRDGAAARAPRGICLPAAQSVRDGSWRTFEPRGWLGLELRGATHRDRRPGTDRACGRASAPRRSGCRSSSSAATTTFTPRSRGPTSSRCTCPLTDATRHLIDAARARGDEADARSSSTPPAARSSTRRRCRPRCDDGDDRRRRARRHRPRADVARRPAARRAERVRAARTSARPRTPRARRWRRAPSTTCSPRSPASRCRYPAPSPSPPRRRGSSGHVNKGSRLGRRLPISGARNGQGYVSAGPSTQLVRAHDPPKRTHPSISRWARAAPFGAVLSSRLPRVSTTLHGLVKRHPCRGANVTSTGVTRISCHTLPPRSASATP